MSADLFVRRVYTYNGINIIVEIDFEKEQITLVERFGGGYRPKKWLFAERELKYMDGWDAILAAMKYAIGQASAVLERHRADKIEDFAKMLAHLDRSNLDD